MDGLGTQQPIGAVLDGFPNSFRQETGTFGHFWTLFGPQSGLVFAFLCLDGLQWAENPSNRVELGVFGLGTVHPTDLTASKGSFWPFLAFLGVFRGRKTP